MSSPAGVDSTQFDNLKRLPHFQTYTLSAAYDEMLDSRGVARDQYVVMLDRLQAADPAELKQRQSAAELAFLNQGITFTVYGNKEGTEKIFPYDLIPRIITAREWDSRTGADPADHDAQPVSQGHLSTSACINDGVVPRELIYSCKHFRREMQGVRVPHDIYVSVTGTDLVRLPDGTFAVLEDNLRVPSGVSYMLTNRQVMKRVFPLLFSATTCARSISTARSCSPRCAAWRPRTGPTRPSCC